MVLHIIPKLLYVVTSVLPDFTWMLHIVTCYYKVLHIIPKLLYTVISALTNVLTRLVEVHFVPFIRTGKYPPRLGVLKCYPYLRLYCS